MEKWIRRTLVLCAFLLPSVDNAFANHNIDNVPDQVEKLRESLKRLDTARKRTRERQLKQLPELIASGERGNLRAQLALSQFYDRGKKKDSRAAMKWLKMAANQDNFMALFLMAEQYKRDEHVPQNNSMAIHWYEMAVKQKKDPTVMFRLGLVYEDEHDYAMAVHWFERSANRDFEPAQLRLGDIYYRGKGVKADVELACQWIRQAVQNGAPNWHQKKADCTE